MPLDVWGRGERRRLSAVLVCGGDLCRLRILLRLRGHHDCAPATHRLLLHSRPLESSARHATHTKLPIVSGHNCISLGLSSAVFLSNNLIVFFPFFIFSPAPPLELIGGQGIVSESSFGKVAQRKTKFIGIVSNFYDNSKYGFYEAGHLQKLDWRTPTMG